MASALRPEPPQRLARALGAGHPWLAGLPALADEVLGRWELTAERTVLPGGRDSVVLLVRRGDGTPAALKLCAPASASGTQGAAVEAAALTHWDGLGAVRLLRADPAAGALLLERLHGEVSLRSLPEAKATLEAVSAVRRLWVPPEPGHPFTTVAAHTAEEVADVLERAPRAVRPLVDAALAVRGELLADAVDGVLLHGDFRQGAVLASDAERAPWLAVGPEPLVGEPAFDLARLARDRLHDLVASAGAAAAARRRVHKLAGSLDVDADRLRGWTLYRAVESGVRHVLTGRQQDGELLLEYAAWL
ncbi:aminoglycoside phosphotransferase family protein [Streptomyces sp. TRM 70351]|uniref:aminoglycoside phosphotransferase family protein n=1 Tax=Streptomyces sp. TRM 70351 TaxID=3116552 RepID=UPI002E7C341B|nr:aminoglycoside phosphotransferase family protein [Streptomyces sp. TRM 70351]MEE1931069.1 aminoglycoside phosphotransferase family protein [Streptomyces sp. TRM 70351]